MEARGAIGVGPKLRSRATARGLEGALAGSCPLRDFLEQRYLLQTRSPVVFLSLCKERELMIEVA